jgi:PAS domain S-box-containing protein
MSVMPMLGTQEGVVISHTHISERKQAEEKLKESETNFRNLVEQSPLPIMISNPDGKVILVNDAFVKLWEMTEDTLGEFYEKYNILQDTNAKEAGDMPLIEKAYKGGERVILPPIHYDPLEMMKASGFDKPSGRKRWIQRRIYPTEDEGGRLFNLVHVVEDITERKQAEESEEHFRALIQQTPIAIEIHSVDGKFLTCNPAYSRISGLQGTELQAVKESYDLRRDEQFHRLGFGPLLEKLYAGEAIEFPVHTYSVSEEASGLGIEVANGDSLWLRSVGFPLKNSAGRTEAVVLMTENVTAQKMAEIKLATSEEKFRQMMAQSPLSIQILNPAGYLEEVNQAWMDLWGVKEEELEALKASWCILEDEQVTSLGLMPLVERAFRGERVVLPDIEYDAGPAFDAAGLPVAGAKKRLVRAYLYPVLDANGEVKNVVDVEEDITERHQAEERLQALIEQTPLAIEIHSVDGKFLTCNPAYGRLTGLQGTELQAVKESFDLRHDEQFHRLGFGPLLERLYAGETVEFPVYSYNVSEEASGLGIEVSDTGSLWLRTIGFPLKNQAGRTEAVVLMTENITEQKMAEVKLATSEEKFRQMLVQSPLSITIHNPAGYIEDVNQAWMDLWGVKEEELEALKASWCILEDEQVNSLGLMPLVKRAFRGERVVLPEFEYDARPAFEAAGLPVAGAKKRWVRAYLYPVLDANGEVKNVVDVEENITERKQAEERLRNYQDRLRALASELTLTEEQERKRIATELHDGAAQSLAFARIQLDSAQKAVVETAAATKLEGLSGLLKDSLQQIRNVLLDLTSPVLNEIGLAAALSEWLEKEAGRRHGLLTSFNDESDDAALTDDARTVVFRNARELVMNAIKHANAKRISVHMASSESVLRITITDDGVGFDPETVASQPNHEGSFGLFSIRERMADMGGALDIESEPGKGCKATLVVPLEKEGA